MAEQGTHAARPRAAEGRQLGILTRHFFGRLFRNDVVDFEDQMKGRLIGMLSILAIVVGWSAELLLFKYSFVPDAGTSWQEKSYLFTLVMILFGIVTLLEWDMLFPDRQDFLALAPLPVRLRTMFGAKLASFVIFVGLFSLAMNSMSSVLFGMYLSQWRSESVVFLVRYVVAHLASAFAACFCVFFAVVFIRSLLVGLLPGAVSRRASILVRFALITAGVFALLAFFAQPAILDSSFRTLAVLKAQRAPSLFRFPPLWFTGLYEVLLGTRDEVFRAMAGRALLALGLSFGAFGLASGLSYARHVRKTLEVAGSAGRHSGMGGKAARALRGLFVPHAEERAVSGFFARTIGASPKHRMTVTYYMAVGVGVVLLFLAAHKGGAGTLTPQNRGFLIQPLVLAFLMLAGIRSAASIPSAPEANWVFRSTETRHPERYVSGLKKAVLFRWVIPLFGLVFGLHLLVWNWSTALGHAAFGLAVTALGVEAIFGRFRKVPFACSYLPGKMSLHTRIVPYALGALIFMEAAGALEKSLLAEPTRMAWFIGIAAALLAAGVVANRRWIRRRGLLFEEEPEPALIGFSAGD